MDAKARREKAREAAEAYGGVLSRARLREVGVDDAVVRREVASERWRTHGRQTVALHTGALDEVALRWRAVWEVGVDIAELDGVSGLEAAGVTGLSAGPVHVSVLHHHVVHPVEGVVVHKVIRRAPVGPVGAGLPRVRPAVAAIRAAHWAVSDRQAALFLCLPVQQRIVTADHLLAVRRTVKGRTRRRFIDLVVRDLALGAQSLGELDFAEACRARGLPEPERQVLRRDANGTVYLDVRWPNGLVVEIDGAAHRQGLALAADNLRANAVTLGEDVVLRIDLVGWRLDREAFLDQVCAGHRLCDARSSRRTASA